MLVLLCIPTFSSSPNPTIWFHAHFNSAALRFLPQPSSCVNFTHSRRSIPWNTLSNLSGQRTGVEHLCAHYHLTRVLVHYCRQIVKGPYQRTTCPGRQRQLIIRSPTSSLQGIDRKPFLVCTIQHCFKSKTGNRTKRERSFPRNESLGSTAKLALASRDTGPGGNCSKRRTKSDEQDDDDEDEPTKSIPSCWLVWSFRADTKIHLTVFWFPCRRIQHTSCC